MDSRILIVLLKVLKLSIAKFNTSAKLVIPVKVRPQSRIAADNYRLPAAISLTLLLAVIANVTNQSGHIPLTTNNVPIMEVFNLTSRQQL